MFDCVLPTRNGRNGQALTWKGPLNLRKAQNRFDTGPIDPGCKCSTCARYSKAYLSHLFRAGEFLAMRLVSLHNLSFMIDFIRLMRESIKTGGFSTFKNDFLSSYRRAS
jgi:queuine tRNA-ribosyltransferase